MMTSSNRPDGFSLIELMIAVAVLAILMVLGIPSFNEMIHNTQIRTAAESMLDGMKIARSEAIRRNGFTQFILGTGTGWRVVGIDAPPGCDETDAIQARSHNEGSTSTSATVTPAGATTITYTPTGWVSSNCAVQITQIDVDSVVLAASKSRELRIAVTRGGGLRLCDPQLAAGDPRACT